MTIPNNLNLGTIEIDSIPDNANVFIGGKLVGKTPITVTDVESGNYTYALKLIEKGFGVFSDNVTVKPQKITHIEVNFNTGKSTVKYLMNGMENGILKKTDIEILTEQMKKISETLSSIEQNVKKLVPSPWRGVYDKSGVILNSVPTVPDDPASNLYQYENVYDILGANSQSIKVYNDGAGILYVVSSEDGVHFSNESVIYEAEYKQFANINKFGLRSPTEALRYRITERNIKTQYFGISRFKERRDSSGILLYQDDYESPTLKFDTAITGLGTIARSTDTAYAGDYSLKLVTGANANDTNIVRYVHTDFHLGKVGSQIRFAIPDSVPLVRPKITLAYFDGTKRWEGSVWMESDDGQIFIELGSEKNVLTVPIVSNINTWNTMKLVIDIAEKYYTNVTINGHGIDLSQYPLVQSSSTNPEQLIMDFSTTSESGAATTIYFDDHIFTEDETSPV